MEGMAESMTVEVLQKITAHLPVKLIASFEDCSAIWSIAGRIVRVAVPW